MTEFRSETRSSRFTGRRIATALGLGVVLAAATACGGGEGQTSAAPTPTGLGETVPATTVPATTGAASQRPFEGPYLEFDDLDGGYPDIYVYPVTESGGVGTVPLGFTFTDGVARAIKCQRQDRRVYSQPGERNRNDDMWYQVPGPQNQDIYAAGTYAVVHLGANGAPIRSC